jgi:accessory gene regulator B
MVDKISLYILDNMLYKNEKIDEEEKEVMLFGITRIVEDIPKYIAILIISILLGITKQVALVLAITLMYKTFVGGAHARTNISCFIFSTLYFITPVLIAKYIFIPNDFLIYIYILLFIQSLYVILKIAPADTEEVPVINKRKRKIMKIMATISLLGIFTYNIFFCENIYIEKIILITIFYINIFTNKFMYKLFKCKYSYESEEFKEYFS